MSSQSYPVIGHVIEITRLNLEKLQIAPGVSDEVMRYFNEEDLDLAETEPGKRLQLEFKARYGFVPSLTYIRDEWDVVEGVEEGHTYIFFTDDQKFNYTVKPEWEDLEQVLAPETAEYCTWG